MTYTYQGVAYVIQFRSPRKWKNGGCFADRSPAIGQQVSPVVVLNYRKLTAERCRSG
jgi:hypothetical protein